MKREELEELHYISPIANIPSIMQYGILSHHRAARIRHFSISMQEVQDKRRRKQVPGGLILHDYVNLYFCARNPMLFKRKNYHENICVLRINLDVLDIPNVIIADQNASSDYVRFYPSPSGLSIMNKDLIFAEYWTHPENQILEFQHRSIKCAEVLVPQCVDAKYILGVYISCQEALNNFEKTDVNLPAIINKNMFFL